MGIRSGIKRGTKRIGRAFGVSDVLDSIQGVKDDFSSTRDQMNGVLGAANPYLKYYYYNEAAKNIHPLLFEKYRNCNKGKKVVLVACGPTLDKYKPIKDAKHIAINRAFLKKNVKFDYIFIHDRMILDDYGKELKNYKADKFAAYATNPYNSENFNLNSEEVSYVGAKRFIITDVAIPDTGGGQFDVIQPDIAHGALYDRGGGTVFSALQFALFTGPSKLYLVGCDCSKNGYFKGVKNNQKQVLLEKTEYLWHEAKVFIDQYYPDTEIISINPVGLKGLFKEFKQK